MFPTGPASALKRYPATRMRKIGYALDAIVGPNQRKATGASSVSAALAVTVSAIVKREARNNRAWRSVVAERAYSSEARGMTVEFSAARKSIEKAAVLEAAAYMATAAGSMSDPMTRTALWSSRTKNPVMSIRGRDVVSHVRTSYVGRDALARGGQLRVSTQYWVKESVRRSRRRRRRTEMELGAAKNGTVNAARRSAAGRSRFEGT